MKILRFDHLHVRPENFEAFNEKFQKFMGNDFLMNMPMPEYGTEIAYEPFPVGVEAFKVVNPAGSVSAKVASESKGVFVLSYRVENIQVAIKEMEELGWKMVEYYDNTPILEALFDTMDDFGFNIEFIETPFDNMRESMAQMAAMQTGGEDQ